jgi:hypothetical protein
MGGTIRGGTLDIAAGTSFRIGDDFQSGTFDGVVINGTVTTQNRVNVLDGHLIGNATITLGAAPGADARLMTSAASLEIASTATVNPAQQTFLAAVGDGTGPVINHGTIDAKGGIMQLVATSTTHDGTLEVRGNGMLEVTSVGGQARDLIFAPGGAFAVTYGSPLGQGFTVGTLNVSGQLNLSTAGDNLALSNFPLGGEFIRVAKAGSIVGQFDSVSPGYEVEYRNGTEIWARFVPEPASLVAFATLILLAPRRRR